MSNSISHVVLGAEYADAEEGGAPVGADAGAMEELPAAAGAEVDEPPTAARGKGKQKGKARGAQAGKGKAPAAPKTPAAKPRAGRCSHVPGAPCMPVQAMAPVPDMRCNFQVSDLKMAERCMLPGCCRSAGAAPSLYVTRLSALRGAPD